MFPIETDDPGRQPIVFALFVCLAITCVSAGYPGISTLGEATGLPGLLATGWIATQSFLLTLPGILIGGVLAKRCPRVAAMAGAALTYSVFVVVLLDVIAFHWIAERFLSPAVLRVATTLSGPLAGHVTGRMIVSATLLLTAVVAYAAIAWYGSIKLCVLWSRYANRLTSVAALGVCLAACVAASTPVILADHPVRQRMAEHSSRHPFCAFHLVAHRGVGPAVQQHTDSLSTPPSLAAMTAARDHDHRMLSVNRTQWNERPQELLPDVVVVVIESFRHELVSSEVMPNLWSYAERGIWCRNHFSGGNATNHGMFSLLNGLEAIWYERDVRYSPLLNRLFRQAGYELGFFGGHNDWREFQMDGYISDEHYDVFSDSPPNWLDSDRTATQRAALFLDRHEMDERRPKLAILYLYSTHANYHSYADDQIFQPAADDRFLIPYSESSRPRVWNRYKNSARSIDRLLAAVLKPDRVIIITGDHGESFLEDGTCGHGIRISQYQNMTPAVIHIPGAAARVIQSPTMHADLLPTLLSAVGIPVSQPGVFDGDDLRIQGPLGPRRFVTRNYLSDDVAIVGPWTNDQDRPFAIRASVSLRGPHARVLNAIDASGNQISASQVECDSALDGWREQRFGQF
jgi:glucan phosphoethanolaminetransferase (alkaline phosphatase superfamily)